MCECLSGKLKRAMKVNVDRNRARSTDHEPSGERFEYFRPQKRILRKNYPVGDPQTHEVECNIRDLFPTCSGTMYLSTLGFVNGSAGPGRFRKVGET